MPRPTVILVRRLSLAVSAICACRSGDIIDDWGPPAGYAVVSGILRTAAGVPISDANVSITRCDSPIGGYLGSDSTDATGFYEVKGQLPPVGLLRVSTDTLRIQCFAFVNYDGVARDSLQVQFSAEARAPAHQTLNLTLP